MRGMRRRAPCVISLQPRVIPNTQAKTTISRKPKSQQSEGPGPEIELVHETVAEKEDHRVRAEEEQGPPSPARRCCASGRKSSRSMAIVGCINATLDVMPAKKSNRNPHRADSRPPGICSSTSGIA